MIYSRSAEYAIRALVFMARVPDGRFAMAKAIAEQEEIPVHFLAKILQDLARKGVLRSNKGPSGGFCLRMPADEIRVLDLIEALDGQALAQAASQVPWTLDGWKGLHAGILEFLETHTVADIAKALESHERKGSGAKRSRRAAARRH